MNILVVAAHPDDEVIGCGGTIARHSFEGDRVDILIMSEGARSRVAADDAEVKALADSANKAATILKAKPPKILGFPDNRLDSVDLLDIVRSVEGYIKKTSPDVVYTHHGGDLNIDHRLVHSSVMTACRPLPSSSVKKVLSFETASSTEWSSASIGVPFKPNHHVNIKDFLDLKMSALECYVTENREYPHARSREAIRSLACLRGCQAGVEAAESFQIEFDLKQ